MKLAVVLAGHRLLDEADAARIQEFLVLLLRVDDHEAALVIFEVPLDQRQRRLADRAEADHHDGAADAAVDGQVVIGNCSLDGSNTIWEVSATGR